MVPTVVQIEVPNVVRREVPTVARIWVAAAVVTVEVAPHAVLLLFEAWARTRFPVDAASVFRRRPASRAARSASASDGLEAQADSPLLMVELQASSAPVQAACCFPVLDQPARVCVREARRSADFPRERSVRFRRVR